MRVAFLSRSPGYEPFFASLARRLPSHQFVPSLSMDLPADALVTAGGLVDRVLLEQHPVGLVQTSGSGFDHIDVPAATQLGVWVANLRASATGNADSVAEHAILLMLALARQLPAARRALFAGNWATPTGFALLGKSACIVGLGDVGSALAVRLRAFGMRIVATRRDPSQGRPIGVTVLRAVELHAALREADHVIVCARPTAENRNLIDAAALAAMKPGAFLINISRGSLVDLDAVQAALESGRLGGAGLDVFPSEPIDPKHPLLARRDVIATPHIGGVTDVNTERSLALVVESLERFAKGERPQFLLNAPPVPRFPLR